MADHFSLAYAKESDQNDPLKIYRDKFYIPFLHNKNAIYFLGNSLGLQPKTTQDEVLNIMEDWASYGVEGFFHGENPWLDYTKELYEPLAKIVGAQPNEIVVMNHLTVNLHLLMISFYNPTPTRYKIICEAKAFPSDQYAFESQVKLHGFNREDAIVEVHPKAGTELITTEDILAAIEENKDSAAVVLFSGVNYYTGQVFDIKTITAAAHKYGINAGFDLAHAAGNIELALHNDDVDFACWCNYKYLNSGPGAIAGAFVHEKHLQNKNIKRLNGWWGNDEANRFKMNKDFTPYPTAQAWQLSTAPMMLMAALNASLRIFDEAGFTNLLQKQKKLSAYLFELLNNINGDNKYYEILTPQSPTERGCQVSIAFHENGKAIFEELTKKGIMADWREPNVIRIAPVPLYNTFEEIFLFAEILKTITSK
ncbi:MAG: kynureninase [Ferruginibacter sp.]